MKQAEKKRRTYNLIQGSVWLALGAFLLTGAWAVRAQERLAGQVVRLHVLAASDRDADQARKLRVRDAVLSYTEGCLSGVQSRDDAAARLQAYLPEITRRAEAILRAEGCADTVRAELAETDFPTRVYEGGAGSDTSGTEGSAGGVNNGADRGGTEGGFALPAGRYLALRVVIGPGAGRNWWCVVFPPLCGGTKRTAETPPARKPAVPEKREEKTSPKRAAENAVPEVQEEKTPETENIQTAPRTRTAERTQTAEAAQTTLPSDRTPPPAAPAVSTVRNLPTAAQRYEVRFRVVELWGRIRSALS